MRFPIYAAFTAALGLASTSDALKILMGNDDGFGSGNLRELYQLLVDAGHEGNVMYMQYFILFNADMNQS